MNEEQEKLAESLAVLDEIDNGAAYSSAKKVHNKARRHLKKIIDHA